MSEEIKQWKPEDSVNAIKEKIRSEFVQLIPPDQWTQMVRGAINEFIEPKKSYGRIEDSDFERCVKDELREMAKAEIKKLLTSPEWSHQWTGTSNVASQEIKKILAENGPEIINAWLSNVIQTMLSTATYKL